MMQAPRYRRTVKAAFAAAILGWTVLAGGPGVAADAGPAVVELFTSQGCSSCPPADKYLGELAQRDGVLALTYHVDYWDYIGWKDTFATPATTQRQHEYGRSLGQRYVYTPQMVIGGRVHEVGSHRMAVDMAIDKAHQAAMVPIGIRRLDGGQIAVSIPKGMGEADILLMRFDAKHTVDIARGENSGRALSYYNVVRDFRRIGVWSGQPVELTLSMAELMEGGRDGCAILLQTSGSGPILGAARIDAGAMTN